MSGHTPGPWEAHQRPESPIECGHRVTTADGLTVCNVTYQLPTRVDGEVVEVARIANARLIAAAPELLEALRDVLGWVPDGGPWHTDAPMASVARARAAIRKATGSQP